MTATRRMIAGSILALGALLLSSLGTLQATGSTTTWQYIPPANPGLFRFLQAVSMSSPTDAWAVGNFTNSTNTVADSLAEHWNGQSWQVVTTPNVPGSTDNILQAVVDLSPTDAWAVGYSNGYPLAEHWNGQRWSIVPAAPGLQGIQEFDAVAATSANDVWAAGTTGFYPSVVERWDGAAWHIIPGSANLPALDTIAVLSPSDAWVAGGPTGQHTSADVEHWNGQGWSIIPVPGVAQSINGISGIAALSSSDIWAVGSSRCATYHCTTPPPQQLIEHWNGSSWSRVPGGDAWPLRLAAVSSTDIWAAGGNSQSGGYSLMQHWNGSTWSNEKIQVPGAPAPNGLWAVTSAPGGAVIAVGGAGYNTFALWTNHG